MTHESRRIGRRLSRQIGVLPGIGLGPFLHGSILAGMLVIATLWPARSEAISLAPLVSFAATNGAQPYAGLVLGGNGNFYGTTEGGGTNSQGTVFEVTTNGTLMVLYNFTGGNDGASPQAGLILGNDGNFYGTASGGGSNDVGTLFEVTSNGTFIPLASFDGTNGAAPRAALLQGADGNFYGTASQGGTNGGFGTVFQLNTNGLITALFSFAGTNGSSPLGSLVQDQQGNFYGTTANGGTSESGTIFRIGPGGGFTNWSFAGVGAPQAGLTFAANVGIFGTNGGSYYGTTASGGTNGDGTVFQFSPQGGISILLSFAGTNGAQPSAGLVQGADGNLYGTTFSGGTNGGDHGTIFSLSPTGAITTLYSFPGGSKGAAPQAPLVQGTDGNFYGTTSGGGNSANDGTIFQLSGFPPFIINQPASQTVSGEATAVLTVLAGGSGPLSYQWQFNSNNLAEAGNFSGTATADLTIADAAATDAGSYVVIVSNDSGSVTSSPAILTVVDLPTVAITSPAQNARVAQSAITITGTAGDNVALSRVYYQVDGTGWNLAATGNGWSNWTAKATLSPGTNTVQAYAVNVFGVASATNSVSVFCTILFSTVSGAYSGLFYDQTNGVSPQSAGAFTITMTTKGAFSGSLQMDAGHYPLHGQFDADGQAQISISRGKATPLTAVLGVDLTQGTDQITGTLSDGTWTAELLGNRAVFDAANPAPYAGSYTMIIPGVVGSASEPAGDSSGTITVNRTGGIRLSVSLADDTKAGQTATVSKNGQWPLYLRLYGGQGLLLGWLNLTNNGSSNPNGNVTWIKAPLRSAKYYPGGFTVQTNVVGSPYVRPAAGANILSFANLAVVLSGGDLAQSITNLVTLGAHDRISGSDGLRLSFSTATGSFTGRLSDAGTPKPLSFGGVILQNQSIGQGAFLGTDQSGEALIFGN